MDLPSGRILYIRTYEHRYIKFSILIARSVNTFILLGDEIINSSLVERGRSLMDPQPHPLLHFLVGMKPMSTNVFVQVAKNMDVTWG